MTNRKIMLIDDDEVLRTLLTRVLVTAGCTVHSCQSIKDALEELKSNAPDLVILDLNMPELDGFTYLKFRHQNKYLASIPVMVLSGTKNKVHVRKALEMGAEQFVEKPFEASIILQKLRYLFHSKETYVYRFAESEIPSVEVEVQGDIVEQASGRIKIESQVRFCAGKSVGVNSDDYFKQGGSPFICRADSQLIELRDGLFVTELTPIGMDVETKKHFEAWLRSTSIE